MPNYELLGNKHVRSGVGYAVLLGLWLFYLGGCMDHAHSPTANAQESASGYKYFTRIRDSAGKYRDSGPLAPGDSYIYVYYINPRTLDAISPDRELAVHQFIENRNAIPPACSAGFRVVGLGSMEHGTVAATIECNKVTDTKPAR
jgi:hypothetical protein